MKFVTIVLTSLHFVIAVFSQEDHDHDHHHHHSHDHEGTCSHEPQADNDTWRYHPLQDIEDIDDVLATPSSESMYDSVVIFYDPHIIDDCDRPLTSMASLAFALEEFEVVKFAAYDVAHNEEVTAKVSNREVPSVGFYRSGSSKDNIVMFPGKGVEITSASLFGWIKEKSSFPSELPHSIMDVITKSVSSTMEKYRKCEKDNEALKREVSSLLARIDALERERERH